MIPSAAPSTSSYARDSVDSFPNLVCLRLREEIGLSDETWILGISGSHNGALCLIHGDEVRVAIQEERLTGVKRARVYGARRSLGLRYCLETAGIKISDLAMVALASQRSSKLEENDLLAHPELGCPPNLPRRVVSHHLAHAASAFATSGYETAAVVVIDGLGSPIEDLRVADQRVVIDSSDGGSEHLSLYQGRGQTLVALEIHAAHNWLEKDSERMWQFFSLGGMYSAVAEQVFGSSMDAGKVMGLAPYGRPTIPIEHFLTSDCYSLKFANVVQRGFTDRRRWPPICADIQTLQLLCKTRLKSHYQSDRACSRTHE